MSINQKTNYKDENSAKRYQPEFPLVYNRQSGPYSSITNKVDSLGKNFINLLRTSPGEWPMNPDMGIGIKRYLFEQSSSNIIQSLKPNITDQLNEYLPHVKLHSIDVSQEPGDIDNNSIKIKINCIIMNTALVSLVAHLNRLAKLIIDYTD